MQYNNIHIRLELKFFNIFFVILLNYQRKLARRSLSYDSGRIWAYYFQERLREYLLEKARTRRLTGRGKRGLFKLTRLNTGSRIKLIRTRGMVPNYNSCLDKEMTVCHRD